MKGKTKDWLAIGFLALVLLLVSQLHSWSQARTTETKPTLAILPFVAIEGDDSGKGVICPLCKGIRRSGRILPDSPGRLSTILFEKIEAKRTFEVISMADVKVILSQIERRLWTERPLWAASSVGRRLNVDFLCVGMLFCFEERIGSRVGVERPASVSFDLHLIRKKDEKVVWVGKFDETQTPLSENLLRFGAFLRRKGSWLRASELASVGMDEVLEGIPPVSEVEESR